MSMLNSESRRLYSWWWDSHISPKNSKWLQENLTDMDTKVKSMIKLIEEDADSFARRAEMYYKKRPELMKLVEEFYRAYRALAERYDYATSELRHAQKTLQAAFPDQEPFTFPEGSSSSIDPNDQKNDSFDLQLFLEGNLQKTNEKDKLEIEKLKKAVADLIAEKDELFVQYQCSLEKLSNTDEELNHAVEKSRILEEKASEAEKEVHMLKETLHLLQAEKESGLEKQMEYLETISDLEEKINGMDTRAAESEAESRDLMDKLTRLESENDAGLLRYGKCLEKISVLEKKIMETEEKAKMFSELKVKAEMEVEKLKNTLLELTEEKEALRVLYSECLEKSYKLELDLSSAQSDVQRLTSEIISSTEKLKHVEEICVRLEKSNESLKMEAGDLAKKIMLKDRELSDKHDELEKLQSYAKDEHTHYVQVEATLETLKMLYTRSQEEQRNLAMELKKGLQMVKDLEICKSGLEEEMKQVKNDNENLKKSEVEFMGLKQMKEKLEEEVALQLGQSTAMQKEISNLKDEITELNMSYNSLMSQLELVGLDPESLGSSVKCLQDENSRLKQICEKNSEHEEKIKTVIEKNNELESSCESLHVEKSALVLEKSVLLSQLHVITVNMQKLVDQNTLLEDSLSTANTELEDLREKSKGLEEVCELLNIEKSNLVVERSMLASQLENVQKRLEILEDRFIQFEDEKQRVLIENAVILTVLEEIQLGYRESELHKTALMNRYETVKDDFLRVKKQNLDLIEVNGNLGLELDMLHEELEERKNIEQNLTSELQERENEFELWDAEATSFIFDLQVSNTRDILYETKVHQLAEVCENLEGETALKDEEIEEMKQKASAMEGEIEDLKAQLLAYTPVIASLKENISSLEHNVFTMAANLVSNNRKSEVEDVEMKVHPHHHDQSDSEFFTENQKSLEPNGVSDLLEFQTRIAALEKVIVEDINVVASRKSTEINIKSNPAKTGTEESKSNEEQKRNKAEKLRGRRYLTLDNLNITKAKPEISESRKGVPIRDIPLDQASDGSSSANSRSRSRRGYLRSDDMMIEQLQLAHEAYETEKKSRRLPYEPQIEDLGVDKLEVPNQESQKGKVLHRLKSDAQKLAELETSVKDLTTRMDTVKKSKKPTGVDYETVKEQLEEAEETILQLVNVNVESTASIEKNPSLAAWVEQEETWKSSEKIKRVQLEVQKIQYVLLALDEKKGKGKSRFSRTKSVIMRDFIRRGKSNSGKSRRRRLCGCFTPSQTKGDRFTPSPMKGDRLPIRH
ncbi:putative protein Networked (NET), actin-binding (NAB) [Helianthus annuus]|nr:putative protein Networked (NET), actin-binding (NAB) [Helianthus annuus]